MANGYGSSSGSSGSSSTPSSSSSARQTTVNAQRQAAPPGYHYMPDGTLMSDVEHARLYNSGAARYYNPYERDPSNVASNAFGKTIKGLVLNTGNISTNGETRSFTVKGNPGAIFSLEVKRQDGYYYNFTTNLFQAAQTRLNNQVISGNKFTGNIIFPNTITKSSTKQATTSGIKVIINDAVASVMAVGDKITGNTFLDANHVTVAALNPDGDNIGEFSMSEAVAIAHDAAIGGTPLFFTSADQYDFLLFAEQGTRHANYKEVRLEDGSIDINASTGSSSNLMQKVLYQTPDVILNLSALSPNAVTAFSGQTPTVQPIVIPAGKNIGKIPFSIPVSASSTHSFRVDRTPTANDVTAWVSRTVGASGSDIPGEDTFPAVSNTDTIDGAISNASKVVMDTNVADKMAVGDKITTAVTTDTVDGAVSSGIKVVMDNNVAGKMSVGDQITGNTFLDANIVTVAALNPDADNVKEFSMSEAVALDDGITLTFSSKLNRSLTTVSALNPDGDNVKEFSMSQAHYLMDGITLSFSNKENYRWPLNNIDGLYPGMVPIGTNITANTRVSAYRETVTEMQGTDKERILVVQEVDAIDKLGAKPTLSRDATSKILSTTQTGNVAFSKQQKLLLGSDVVKFYCYGSEGTKTLTGWDVEFSDITVTVTKPTALTTSAVINSTSVPIDNADGIMDDVSTVSGIGIDPGAVDPTVTTIGSYSGSTATLTLSAAQTLESGTTLTFNGSGRTITIAGNIEIKNSNQIRSDWDGFLYFDLEKFITATDES